MYYMHGMSAHVGGAAHLVGLHFRFVGFLFLELGALELSFSLGEGDMSHAHVHAHRTCHVDMSHGHVTQHTHLLFLLQSP